jgi:4'-phosphopantetheinyl transferase EntD
MRAHILATLLPPTAAVVVADDGLDPPPLLPDEQPFVANAVDKRRREFAQGRHCARLALGQLGVCAQPILVGRDRQPEWPAGIVGSITHCAGVCAAAVARASDMAGLGIDAESAEPLTDDLLAYVCTLKEREQWRGAAPVWPKLAFSAKESVYKCIFPCTGRFLDFLDVELSLRLDGTFTASSAVVDLRQIVGRYALTSHHVLTSAVSFHRQAR